MNTYTTALLATMALLIGALAAPAAARADDGSVELTLGFRGSLHDYSGVDFALDHGGESLGQLGLDLLGGDDVSSVFAVGMRVAMRATLSPGIRITMGFDLPEVQGLERKTRTVTTATGDHSVRLSSVDHWGFELGLGASLPIFDDDGPGAVYLDLIGSFHNLTADLLIDGAPANYTASTFDPIVRLGARFPLEEALFLHVNLEAGLAGDTVFGGEIGVGVGAF